jgi:hypothetical protein
MNPILTRLLAASAICVSASLLSAAACTRTTDRVIEPVGAGDASAPSPEVGDASLNPLTPIAHPPEPAEDFRLVRGNEFGGISDAPWEGAPSRVANRAPQAPRVSVDEQQIPPGLGGSNGSGGAAGGGGADQRPVGAGGHASKNASYW